MDKKVEILLAGIITFVLTLIGSIIFFHYQQKNTVPTEVVLQNLPEILVEVNNEYPDELRELLENLNFTNENLLSKDGESIKDTIKAEDMNAGTNKQPDYIGEQVKAYYSSSYFTEYSPSTGQSFSLGGVSYNRGFTIGRFQTNASYNLDEKYTKLSGIAGNIDGDKVSDTFNILGDGKLLSTISIEGAALPIEFEVDVTGVRQLTIEIANSYTIHGEPFGFANVILE